MNTSFDHKDATQNQRPSQRENQSAKAYPSRTIVHAKLEMTEPGDHDEQEADAMADAVVSGGKISRKISGGGGGSSGIAVSQQMESQLSQLQGGGRQMPEGLRNMMENGFGQDFGHVRIHTDAEAADMSSSIGARAFTLGNDIYFNCGQFNPETTEGQRLVAHELTHVVQGTGKVGRKEKEVWQNRQRVYEAELALAFEEEGKYKLAFNKLLTHYYGHNLDGDSLSAIDRAFFSSNYNTFRTNRVAFCKALQIQNPRIYNSINVTAIADTIEKHGLFVNDYKKVIRTEYNRVLEEEIETKASNNHYVYYKDEVKNNYKKRLIASDDLYSEKTNVLLENKSKTTGLKYIEYLIVKRHHDYLRHYEQYYVTPDSLISGKSWTTIFFSINAALFSPIITAISGGIIATAIISAIKGAVTTAIDEAIKYQYGDQKERDNMTVGKEAIKIFKAALINGIFSGISKIIGKLSESTKDVTEKAILKAIDTECAVLQNLYDYLTDALLNEKPPKKDFIASVFKTLILNLIPIFSEHNYLKETVDNSHTFVSKVASLD